MSDVDRPLFPPLSLDDVISVTIYDDATGEVIYDSEDASSDSGMTVVLSEKGLFKLTLDTTP